MISRSPAKYLHLYTQYQRRLAINPDDEQAALMITLLEDGVRKMTEQEESEEWAKYNMEYDLLSTGWILDKVRRDEVYAQHLYAALCNSYSIKNEAWAILLEKQWSCSWRHAGGIVADMQSKGDYMNWYCSGISSYSITDDEFRAMTKENQERYLQGRSFVSEGTITDDIRADLLKLGWQIFTDED